MWASVLERKLLRELRRLAGQIATIALVVASGITSFVALRATFASIDAACDRYYDAQRFADVFAMATRAPESVAEKLGRVPGIATLETRIAEEVTLPLEGMERPAYGRLLSLPDERQPATNVPYLRLGRWPERGSRDETVVLESFVEAHGFRLGDSLPVVINGKLRHLSIVGVALSPEFVFAIRPGALADDPSRYAVLWMARTVAAAAYGLEGAFNELSARLEPGASEPAVRAAIDRALGPYGGEASFGRKEQLSHRVLTQELSQLGTLSTMVPLVFLGVALFLVNLVLARLVRLQRGEIATLKALGYRNRAIGLHYLALVAVVVVPGAALGVLAGRWLGGVVLGLYTRAFRFPEIELQVSPGLLAVALLASGAAAAAGAVGALWGSVRLPPAEAMSPPAPPRYRRSVLDRLGVRALLGPSAMMVLREIVRRPLRTAFSSLGIAGAVALLILGRFGWDSLLAYFDNTFLREQRQDLQVTFSAPLPPRVLTELASLPGVARAEGLRGVPVRVQHGHRYRETLLLGLPSDMMLRRLVDQSGAIVPLPSDGVILSRALAEALELNVGDRPEVLIREGGRDVARPLVAGFVADVVGLSIYASSALVAAYERDSGAVSAALLRVDPAHTADVEERLRRSPRVIDISDVRGDMNRLLDMNASIMSVWTLISVLLAASVVFGVVYNNARIALGARSRELASLRVLGFSRREVSSILLYGLAFEVLSAIPIGLWLGRLWAERFMQSVDQETFRWQVDIAPRTYLLVVTVVLLAAATSALWVRRNVDQLDLVAVLKSRE